MVETAKLRDVPLSKMVVFHAGASGGVWAKGGNTVFPDLSAEGLKQAYVKNNLVRLDPSM